MNQERKSAIAYSIAHFRDTHTTLRAVANIQGQIPILFDVEKPAMAQHITYVFTSRTGILASVVINEDTKCTLYIPSHKIKTADLQRHIILIQGIYAGLQHAQESIGFEY